MSSAGIFQRMSACQQRGQLLLARRAQILGLNGAAFKELLRRMEQDSLLRRLLAEECPGGPLIKRRGEFPARGRSFAAQPDADAVSAGTSDFELGRTLEVHAEAVNALRELGFERAKTLLAVESAAERKSCFEAWGLDKETAELVQALMEHLSVRGTMATLDGVVPARAARCSLVARLELGPNGNFAIVPLVSHARMGRYAIEYDRIEQARHGGFFSQTESERLPSLLGELESINYRGETFHQVLRGLAHAQAAFLRSGNRGELVPLTQRSLAQTLGVHPSVVCRAVADRSLLMPWGEERPMASLFPGKHGRNLWAVEVLLSSEPRLSDREIARRVLERFGCRISRRSVALYRGELSIPNVYNRRRSR